MDDLADGAVGSTHCHTCKGNGVVVRQVAVTELASGQTGTGLVHVTCRQCGNAGRLPGFQPPV